MRWIKNDFRDACRSCVQVSDCENSRIYFLFRCMEVFEYLFAGSERKEGRGLVRSFSLGPESGCIMFDFSLVSVVG